MMSGIFGMPPAAGTAAGFGMGFGEWGENGDVSVDCGAWCWPCWLRS